MPETVDLSTPRRAVATFLEAAHREDWDEAASFIQTRTTTKAQAVERAKQLDYLLERRAWVRLDTISDEPGGTPEDGADTERAAVIWVNGEEFPIVLEKSKSAPARWGFSADTLAHVPAAYKARGPSWIELQVPASLRTREVAGMEAWQAVGLPVALLLAIVLGRVLAFVMRGALRPVARRTRVQWDDELLEAAHRPLRLLACAILFVPLSYPLALPSWLRTFLYHGVYTVAVISVAWLAHGVVGVLSNLFERRAVRSGEGREDSELHTRGARTQVEVFRRVATIVVLTVGVALVLTQFDSVRSAGISLLASAGVAGVVLGLAAQRTIGSVLAGVQLSATQPIRIGDTVVIENEYGTIEEITLTYAVLKVWDERRLVVPLTRFLEQPFQNLTKRPSGQIGAVFLYANWTLPIPAVREQLAKVLENIPQWDGRVSAVHVSDAKERTIEVRILVSTGSPSTAYEIRAQVREALISWLQAFEGGKHLPALPRLGD